MSLIIKPPGYRDGLTAQTSKPPETIMASVGGQQVEVFKQPGIVPTPQVSQEKGAPEPHVQLVQFLMGLFPGMLLMTHGLVRHTLKQDQEIAALKRRLDALSVDGGDLM